MITRLPGLTPDILRMTDGALTIGKTALVEITHLFAGISTFPYYLRINWLENILVYSLKE